jgi:hypothetical protein
MALFERETFADARKGMTEMVEQYGSCTIGPIQIALITMTVASAIELHSTMLNPQTEGVSQVFQLLTLLANATSTACAALNLQKTKSESPIASTTKSALLYVASATLTAATLDGPIVSALANSAATFTAMQVLRTGYSFFKPSSNDSTGTQPKAPAPLCR